VPKGTLIYILIIAFVELIMSLCLSVPLSLSLSLSTYMQISTPVLGPFLSFLFMSPRFIFDWDLIYLLSLFAYNYGSVGT
jgi:hypothetical protein